MSDLATNYRALADVLDKLETVDAVDVDDAELLEVTDDTIQASVTITAPAEPTQETSVTDADQEEHVDEAVEEDIDEDADEEIECDVDGCEYTGNQQGLAIHKGRAHTDDEDPEIRCSDCGETFDSEHGLSIHRGHQHGSDDEEDRDDEDDLEDTSELGTGDLTPAVQRVDDTSGQHVDDEDAASNGKDASEAATSVQTKGFADAPDDTSEEEPTSYPWVCRCGVVCSNAFEKGIHRTEAHGVPQARLDYLEPGEFQEKVDDASTVSELAENLGWSTERVLRALGIYGFDGAVAGDGLPDDPTTACDLLTPDTDAEEAGPA
ncbi:hypothetical protein HWV23_02305 [Natronomonas halophila]|uniref:hypothetical protein n=1 Tax=Natronomonas halophila TaxID=2747817 RepID=UPI0015B3C377|nr:hypothetical protein [Natronomonas halophila]QLD84588.1 hypothetical protein HWV23_02305 [Natronomonas halophila]